MVKGRKAPERQIPIVSAVIALVFFSAILLGAASVIVSRLSRPPGDTGLHIDGTWEIEAPTHNDEHIIYSFAGDTFSSVTESMIFDADPEVLEAIGEFLLAYSGAVVEAEDMGDGNFLMRITADGTFAFDGNNIRLVSGEGLVRLLSFAWEGEAVIIDGYRFMRR